MERAHQCLRATVAEGGQAAHYPATGRALLRRGAERWAGVGPALPNLVPVPKEVRPQFQQIAKIMDMNSDALNSSKLNPALLAMADLPVAPSIKAHSIVAVKGDGDYHQGR